MPELELSPAARAAIFVGGMGAAAVLALYFFGRSKPNNTVGLSGPPESIGYPTYDDWWRAIGGPSGMPYEPTDHVVTFDNGATLITEVVRTPRRQARGLMYRQSLPENNGMLFVYDASQANRGLWMRNTRIDLDGIFLDEHGMVVWIIESLVPMSDEIRSVASPSKYILETNAGWAKRHGVHVGSRFVPETLTITPPR